METGTWTQESVLALAPDPESVKAGKGLATKSKWVTLACSEAALWGECLGSGSKPYQTRVDLTGPAFKCTCPSRKFPCKHALALFLLYAQQPASFSSSEPPDWVAEWLASRGERAQKQTEKKEKAAPDPAAQAKRQTDRLAKVEAGIDDLERWLRDLIRSGLAQAPAQPYSFWDKPASRLVDAQAPGLARMLRELAGISSSGPHWPDRLLAKLGKIQLLIDAFRRRDALPEEVVADVRSLIGFPVSREEVLRGNPVRDDWRVIGQVLETDLDGMRAQRSWLQGKSTGRIALLLQFAHRSQALEGFSDAVGGTQMTADLGYYPGAVPLRALLVEKRSGADPLADWSGSPGIAEALEPWREALTRKPWLEDYPLTFEAVTPVRQGEQWLIRDGAGRGLPLARRFTRGWDLLAISGGRPVGLFGVWNGEDFLPLSAWVRDRFISLAPREVA